MTEPGVEVARREVEVDGTTLSWLEAGDPAAPPLLLLHGTFWSRVWAPVLPALGQQHHCVALDLPGFGRSGGELDVEHATVPALADTVVRVADALGMQRFDLAGHDIGGGIAQHVAATSGRVDRLVLMNAVLLDSWPVPAVARFRDPDVRAATTPADLLAARETSTRGAIARPLSDAEVAEWLAPWHDEARVRSWIAMAAAADDRYTRDLLTPLVRAAIPTLLVWGRDDDFQKVTFAHRYAQLVPRATVVEVPGKHIPTEDSPAEVAAAVLAHLDAG